VLLLPDVDFSACKAALSLPLPYRQRQGALESKAMTRLPYKRIYRHLEEPLWRLDVTFTKESLGLVLNSSFPDPLG
jgi:hypothetical protein